MRHALTGRSMTHCMARAFLVVAHGGSPQVGLTEDGGGLDGGGLVMIARVLPEVSPGPARVGAEGLAGEGACRTAPMERARFGAGTCQALERRCTRRGPRLIHRLDRLKPLAVLQPCGQARPARGRPCNNGLNRGRSPAGGYERYLLGCHAATGDRKGSIRAWRVPECRRPSHVERRHQPSRWGA